MQQPNPPSAQPPIHLWGVSAPLQPLTGGHRNLAFRTLGLPQDLVFKSTRRSPEAMHWLLPVHDLARQSGFRVPHLRPSRDGHLIESSWTCEAFLSGAPLTAQEMPSLLPMIERFHDLTKALPQRPGFLSSQQLLHQPAGGDVDLDAMPPELARSCRAAWHPVSDGQQSIVHGDLNPGNLLRGPDGCIALLDWDECRRDLTLFDLGQLRPPAPAEARAQLAWEIACSWQVEPDHARALSHRL